MTEVEESGLINYTRFLERYRVQVRERAIVEVTVWGLLERS